LNTILIAACLLAGIITGHLLCGAALLAHCDDGITILLYVMLFLVGLELGTKNGIRSKIREIGMDALALPLLVIAGSLLGAIAAGLLLGVTPWQSAAVGAGFGWYSLSGVILGRVDSLLGAVAFLSNIAREVIALLFIPIFSKYIHPWAGIAAGGATAMDTTLPVVVKASGPDYAIHSFLSGVILSTMVPVTISIILAIAGVH
jgi:uncharacterized membrane protein YbjE (DUF340 family)